MQAVSIGKQPLLTAVPRHHALVRAEDIDSPRVFHTVSIEIGDGHIIKSRRNQGKLQGVKTLAQNILKFLHLDFILAACLHHLLEQTDNCIENPSMLARLGQAAGRLSRICPFFELSRRIEKEQEMIKR